MPRYSDLKDRLDEGDVIILDGAVGTQLQAMGVPMHPVGWCGPANDTHPATVALMHERYIKAGADVITTNTWAILSAPEEYPEEIAQLAAFGIRRPRTSHYEWFLEALRAEVTHASVPVLLIHGDTHYFRFDQPLLADGNDPHDRLENFHRLETHGSPHSDQWITVNFGPGPNPELSVTSHSLRRSENR